MLELWSENALQKWIKVQDNRIASVCLIAYHMSQSIPPIVEKRPPIIEKRPPSQSPSTSSFQFDNKICLSIDKRMKNLVTEVFPTLSVFRWTPTPSAN